MLCFLSRLHFIEKINGDLVEEKKCIKEKLVYEFEDYNIATMVYVSDIIDEMIVLIVAIEKNALLKKNNPLRGKIYYLISFKHFFDTSNER